MKSEPAKALPRALSYNSQQKVGSGFGLGLQFAAGVSFIGWLVVVIVFAHWLVTSHPEFRAYSIAATHLVGIAFLMASYRLFFLGAARNGDSARAFGQPISWPLWRQAFVAMALVYLIGLAYAKALGIPREPYMANIYDGKTAIEISLMLLAVVTIVPISEEFALRYFLLGAMTFGRSAAWRVLAVIGTSVIFSLLHWPQYQFSHTKAIVFAVGCVCGWARVKSGGMLLPISLHAFASALATALNELG